MRREASRAASGKSSFAQAQSQGQAQGGTTSGSGSASSSQPKYDACVQAAGSDIAKAQQCAPLLGQ